MTKMGKSRQVFIFYALKIILKKWNGGGMICIPLRWLLDLMGGNQQVSPGVIIDDYLFDFSGFNHFMDFRFYFINLIH